MASHVFGDNGPLMSYRRETPEASGFDNAEERDLQTREYVLSVGSELTPDNVMDTLLMMSNSCAMQSVLHGHFEHRAVWFDAMSQVLRHVVASMATDGARPDIRFEDATLYFPDTDKTH